MQAKPTTLPPTLQSALDYPVPQVTLGQELLGVATSMIDISDGLGQDLGHILTASGVGAVLHLDKIPCADILNTLPTHEKYQHILNGGDDYQLCLTVSRNDFERFNTENPNRIYAIGEIVGGRGLRLLDKGNVVTFGIQGWAHF